MAQRAWSPERRFHIGDIAWDWHSIPDAESAFRVALWQENGVVLAWAWVELPGHLELLVDPAATSLLPQLLGWFETVAPGPTLSCLVMETDRHERAALSERGYTVQDTGPFFRRHTRDLSELPALSLLPDGFVITPVAEDDAGRRAAAHRAGWSDFGSRVTADSYRNVMATYPYRAPTDLVVVAPDGGWVASALGWYDDLNRVGLVEPVSCAPAFRGKGLAKAVNIALLHAFRSLGATHAVILPRGDQAYPVPARLYQAIGYQPGPRTLLYTRH
ncbi:GNAT family N-acetyltransferase [Nocardia sp. CA-119907]|uniref:GNAT family N-acetyltransferase n=1 Tax=Nocardia sp. CA-119907 TaxID=3239973 RepID=UPI003D9A0212